MRSLSICAGLAGAILTAILAAILGATVPVAHEQQQSLDPQPQQGLERRQNFGLQGVGELSR